MSIQYNKGYNRAAPPDRNVLCRHVPLSGGQAILANNNTAKNIVFFHRPGASSIIPILVFTLLTMSVGHYTNSPLCSCINCEEIGEKNKRHA